MGKFKDLTGLKFGRLKVIGIAERRYSDKRKRHDYYWECLCECGNKCIVCGRSLVRGNTRSCGCLHRESAIENVVKNHTHKLSRTTSYNCWRRAKGRCYNINNKSYKNYGARGITMYEHWIHDFAAFHNYVSKLEHFGETGYSLDRINNDGDYAPGNLRWADVNTQCRNRRSNIVVEYNGKRMTLIEAAKLSGLNYGTLNGRANRGDTGERLFRPIRQHRKRQSNIFIEGSDANVDRIQGGRQVERSVEACDKRATERARPIPADGSSKSESASSAEDAGFHGVSEELVGDN